MGFSPVSSVVTTAQTISARTMAPPRMAQALYQGRAVALGDVEERLFLIHPALPPPTRVISVPTSPLVGRPGVDHAGDLTAAEDQDAVAQLQQHVQVLADVDDGDALHLLLRQQVVNGIGGVDVQAAHGVGRHQHGGGLGDLAADQHLLHVAAGHAAHGEGRAGRDDVQLFPDAVGQRFGLLAG